MSKKRIEVTGLDNDNLLSQYNKALKLNRSISREYDSYVLDLTNVKWITPTFLAPVSVLYQELSGEGIDVDVKYPHHHGVNSYLSQIGFPAGSEEPTEEYDNHLPLCRLSSDSGQSTSEKVTSKLRDLLKKQFPDMPSSGLTAIEQPITEIIDNVDQHSNYEHGAFLMQYYPKKEFLDFCIVDNGRSIPGNYDYHGVKYEGEEEAVRMALRGISTKEDFGHNRGFGLKTTANLVCDGLNGRIVLSSHNATLTRVNDATPYQIYDGYTWGGTTFAARLQPPEGEFPWQKYMH